MPQAIIAFLESTNFEDALRTAVSLGGDSDTGKVLCSVTSVEQSAPLSDVLASMSDDQLADVSYYSTDDIPEY